MKKQVVDSLKVILEITKLVAFDGNNFKRWKERVLPILEFTEINRVLYEPKPKDDPKNIAKWEKTNKLCVHTIKCGLSNKLFDIIVILLVLKIFRRNLIVVMGLRMRVLKSLLRLNLCLFKWLRKKMFLAKLKIFKN